MNKITPLEVEYIRSSRTIETIEVSQGDKLKILYIYNYEGIHYRLFGSLILLIQFFELGIEPYVSFDKETELDAYLEGIII